MAGEKRSADELVEHQESVVILDVEGTTSSISFVKDMLFPHVREHLKKHVTEKWNDEEFKADLVKLKAQAKEDEAQKVDGFVAIKDGDDEEAKETVIKNVLWQMDNDRKTGALKQLQGHIWKAKHAPLKGHVYDDVPKAFEEWTNCGKKLYIYSSGSVEAQKLLFGDSIHGDLLKYLSGHFDTEVGPKQEVDSYKNILKTINVEPANALFLTDVVKEAEAAKAAGLSTTIVVREGNAKLSEEETNAYKTIESFVELSFPSNNKRQKIENESETEKKEAPMEEKPAAVTDEPPCEPMDTSEDVEVTEKKAEVETDDKVVESKIEEAEKSNEIAKPINKEEKIEKDVTPMEEDAKNEEKTITKTEIEKSVEVEPVKEAKEDAKEIESVAEEKSKTELSVETEKEVVDTEKDTETEKKTEETTKVTEKVVEEVKVEAKTVEESAAKKETEEVEEKVAEKVADKVVENVTETIVEETTKVTKTEEEAKPEEKEVSVEEKKPAEEVKENGESKVIGNEKIIKPEEDKIDEGENKENVATKLEKTSESEIEVAEEAKEVEKEKEPEDKAKSESETQKDETKKLNGTTTNGDSTKDAADGKVHSNGISDDAEKTKENGDAEESLKVKKAVADGAGEPDVVTPPVVAATS